MVKQILKTFLLVFLIVVVCMFPASYTNAQEAGKKVTRPSPKESADISSQLQEEVQDLEEDVDKISSQFEKIVDIIIEKYKVLMPKIKATTANIQKKIQELMDSFQEEDTTQ